MRFILLTFFSLLISACSYNQASSLVNVQDAQIIKTSDYDIFSIQEITNTQSDIIRLYIEGDGRAWKTKYRPSDDPTPKNPVAYYLFKQDPVLNKIYLARPCQYTAMRNCTVTDWTDGRYSQEIIESYNEILNNLDAKTFEIVGYSGGAMIALILAGQRDDIVNIITVAGNLDHKAHSLHHNVSTLNKSLNSLEYKDKLKNIPQIHFAGSKDVNTPISIYDDYIKQIRNNNNCFIVNHVDGVSHGEGWEKAWPILRPKIDRLNEACHLGSHTLP